MRRVKYKSFNHVNNSNATTYAQLVYVGPVVGKCMNASERGDTVSLRDDLVGVYYFFVFAVIKLGIYKTTTVLLRISGAS